MKYLLSLVFGRTPFLHDRAYGFRFIRSGFFERVDDGKGDGPFAEIFGQGLAEHLAFSGEQEPDVDLSGVWEEIESQLDFRPSVWKRLKEGIGRPVVWIPTAFAATAAALLIFLLPMPKKQMPMTVSQIESVYSQTGQVMVMQTASSGQPLIWILPRPEKEVSG